MKHFLFALGLFGISAVVSVLIIYGAARYQMREAGFLLVFCSDKSTVCLYTHIPVTDFPESERVRLMEGIWFSDMMDVYHYLESYTS